MSIKQIRTQLKQWLEATTRIDDWDLDTPKNRNLVVLDENGEIVNSYPANCAFYDAIADVDYQKRNAILMVTATFRYYINYRFESDYALHELPIAELEDHQQYLITSLIESPNCLGNTVSDITVTREEYPLMVRRIEGEDSDWMITMVLPYTMTFRSKPDDQTSINPPVLLPEKWQLKGLQIDVWKRPIDDADDDLDRSFIQDYEVVQ